MRSNCIVFGWNRPLAGREAAGGQLFQSFVEFLTAQQRGGAIDSFEVVLLEPRGGTLNGFFLLRGDPDRLNALTAGDEWMRHQTRAIINLDGAAVLRGATGSAVAERMKIWLEEIPRA